MAPSLRSYVARMNRELRSIASRSNLSSPPPASVPVLVDLLNSSGKYGFAFYAGWQIVQLAKEYPVMRRVLAEEKLVNRQIDEMFSGKKPELGN